MAESTLERDPLEVLAAEFTARLRAGERPSIEEFAARQPDCAEQIRELFPTIAAMEQWKSQRESKSGGRASLGPMRLKQLGDFRILREIGRGGMGIVYEAEQLSLSRRVAVKVLPKQSLLDDKHLLRFRREARTAAKLHHTNIVPVLGIGEHDGFHYIVMQYIDGVSVDAIIPQLARLHGTPGSDSKRAGSPSASSATSSFADSSPGSVFPSSSQPPVDQAAVFKPRGLSPDANNPPPSDSTTDPHGSSSSAVFRTLGVAGKSGSSANLRVENVTRAILRGEFQPLALDSSDSLASSGISHSSSDSLTVADAISPRSSSDERLEHAAAAAKLARGEEATVSVVRNGAHSLDFDYDINDEDQEPSEEQVPFAKHSRSLRFGPAYWRSVARMGVQVADALQYAHLQGTLHRDIKPANLLVDQRGLVWVADFGLAKAVEQDDVSRTGDVVGTLRYMAPEQLIGQADKRSDIFSLGLTLYELLTFRPAYNEGERKRAWVQHGVTPDPPRPRKLMPSVPRDLETIVLKAIDLDPQRRYRSAAELAEDLHRFLEDRPIRARRATAVEYVWRWCRRNPAVASLSGLAVLLMIAVTLISSIGYARTTALNESVNEALRNEREQSRQAVIARHAADEARHKAEVTSELAWNALDQMVARFAPRRTISPEPFLVETDEGEALEMETQPVLSKETAVLLEGLLSFYDRLAEQGDNSVSYQRRIAEANRRVGDIQQRLGRLEQAEAAYRRAIEIYLETDRQTKPSAANTAQLASAYNELGKILRLRRRSDEAGRAFETARQILQPLVAQSQAPEARYELARAHYLQSQRLLRSRGGGPPGDLWRRGSAPNGNGRFRGPRGTEDRQTASTAQPELALPPSPTVDAHPPAARAEPDRPTASAVPASPRSSDPLARLSQPSEFIGSIGVPNTARPPDRPMPRAIPPSDRPLSPPSNRGTEGRTTRPELPGGGSGDRFRGSDSNLMRDRESLDTAVGLLEPLTKEYPAVPDYQQLLALLYLEQAHFPRREHPDEAVTKVEQAVAILTQLVSRHPGNPDYQFTLSIAYTLRPTPATHSAAEQSATQIEHGNQALAILRKLNLEHPHVLDYLAAQVPILMNVGLAYDRTRQYAEAEQCFRQSLHTQETLGQRYPEAPGYQQVADFMRHPYIDFLLKRYEQTRQTSLLEEAEQHLKKAADRVAAGDQRYVRFVRFKILENLARLASLQEAAGNHEAQAQILEEAARFRGEPVSPTP
jgi:serine/threonine protein kinase